MSRKFRSIPNVCQHCVAYKSIALACLFAIISCSACQDRVSIAASDLPTSCHINDIISTVSQITSGTDDDSSATLIDSDIYKKGPVVIAIQPYIVELHDNQETLSVHKSWQTTTTGKPVQIAWDRPGEIELHMVGTNDEILSILSAAMNIIHKLNSKPDPPQLTTYARDLRGALDQLHIQERDINSELLYVSARIQQYEFSRTANENFGTFKQVEDMNIDLFVGTFKSEAQH